MQRPNVDDDLTLLTDVGKTEAIVVEVLDNPATEEGVLLKVMTRGSFEQGQQVWIVDRDRSKVGATVEKRSQANHRQRGDALDGVAGIAVAIKDDGCADRSPCNATACPSHPLLVTSAGLLSAPLSPVIKLWPPLPIT